LHKAIHGNRYLKKTSDSSCAFPGDDFIKNLGFLSRGSPQRSFAVCLGRASGCEGLLDLPGSSQVPIDSGVEETYRSSWKEGPATTGDLNSMSFLPLLPSTVLHQQLIFSTALRFSLFTNFAHDTQSLSTYQPFVAAETEIQHRHHGSRRWYRLGYHVLLCRCLP
jgi:hypothetical protein